MGIFTETGISMLISGRLLVYLGSCHLDTDVVIWEREPKSRKWPLQIGLGANWPMEHFLRWWFTWQSPVQCGQSQCWVGSAEGRKKADRANREERTSGQSSSASASVPASCFLTCGPAQTSPVFLPRLALFVVLYHCNETLTNHGSFFCLLTIHETLKEETTCGSFWQRLLTKEIHQQECLTLRSSNV